MINSTKERPFIPLSYDLVFKRVFADEYDKRPLKTLLNVILNIDISTNDITILNSEMVGKNVNTKRNTVDLIVKLKDGTKVGIEMNRASSDKLVFRNTLYMFRLMGHALNKGARYEDIDEYIQINFDMDGEHSEPIDIYTLCNEKHPDKKLTNKLQIYRINVPYFTKRCYNLREEELAYKDRFIGMIGAKTLKEINKIAGRDNIMEEMSKKVEECNEDEDILYQYNYGEYLADLAILEGTEKGIQQGLEKGFKEGQAKGFEQGKTEGFEEGNEDEDILYQYNYGEYLADLAILEGTEKGIKQGLEKGIKQGLEKGIKQGLEKGMKQGLEKGIKEGLEKGIQQGLKEGQAKGFEQGKNEGFEQGKTKGYEEGLNLGKQEALKQQERIIEESKNEYKVDMITKMLAKGLSPEVISEITGLEVEKIAEIDL